MFETDAVKAAQIQSDVLLESTANNENFTYHKLANKNKSLDTSDKRMVGAVNEILKKQNSLQNAVQNSINQQFAVLGDVIAYPELLDKLQSVSGNLIEAVSKHDIEITNIKEISGPQEKDICFVIPRVNMTTKSPEIFFPFKGQLTRIVASVSSFCENRENEDADIPIDIEYLADDKEWRKFADATISKNEFVVSKNFNDPELIVNNRSLRIKINSLPDGETTDMSVILCMKVINN